MADAYLSRGYGMSTSIVVGISENSTMSIFSKALDIARSRDARIIVVHVFDCPIPCRARLDYCNWESMIAAERARGRMTLERALARFDNGVPAVEGRMLMRGATGSTVGRDIASICEASDAGLVILGSRRQGWWRFLDEDVARNVRRHTSTPVQIVDVAFDDARPREHRS